MPSSTLCEGCTSKFSVMLKVANIFGAAGEAAAAAAFAAAVLPAAAVPAAGVTPSIEKSFCWPAAAPAVVAKLLLALQPSEDVFELEAFKCELEYAIVEEDISMEDSFEAEFI